MVSKKLITAMAKLANDLDSVNLKKEATAIDYIWIRLAYGTKDYSRFRDLKDFEGKPFDFNLDAGSFNKKYDLPHPYDAESYWDQKLNAPPPGQLEAIDDAVSSMAFEIGGSVNAPDAAIRDAWMKVFDELLSPVGFKPAKLPPNWKEKARSMLMNYLQN